MTGLREKYLAALEEQERMEKQFSVQSEYLRKTLTHLSAAAHGLDETLDATLVNLKDKMRGASGPQVIEQMEKVHQAVTDFERRRGEENQQAVNKFGSLVSQLLALQLPPEVRKKLETYNHQLKTRLDSWRMFPVFVSELAVIQKIALDAAARPQQSFWQRLKGGRTLNEESTAVTSTVKTESVRGIEDPAAEDGYEKVARRINQTLQGLLDNIEPNEVIKHKVDIVQSRLSRGMDWFALATTLEDVRDILMQRYLRADKEFGDYLQKVNDDLNSIREKLGLAVSQEGEQSKASENFSNAVSRHVNNMQNSLDKGLDLGQLKKDVVVHIGEIQAALAEYQQSQQQETVLAGELNSLIDKVKTIESESERTRKMLEQERHKATHDPLTQLPNREAYNERIWQETERFKRYDRPLTLAVCDIDKFKNINDSYGHQAGDKVLLLVSRLLTSRLRQVDFIARYGGEEFVIILPETNDEQALEVLNKIRSTIAQASFRFREEPVQITVSFGIAQFSKDDHVESVFARADKSLYEAKHQGRNRCIVANKK